MNLVIVEEAQAIVGWESIRETIFHEEHYRKNEAPTTSSSTSFESSSESSFSKAYASPPQSDGQHADQESPLRALSDGDFFTLKVWFLSSSNIPIQLNLKNKCKLSQTKLFIASLYAACNSKCKIVWYLDMVHSIVS